MDKSALEKYASVKVQIAELEAICESLKPDIISDMVSEGAEKVNTSWGSFTLQQNRKWTFTSEVESVRVELKEKEAYEKASGKATYEETPILKFTSKKNKEDPTQ